MDVRASLVERPVLCTALLNVFIDKGLLLASFANACYISFGIVTPHPPAPPNIAS